MRTVAIVVGILVGCAGSASAERQAQGRAGDGDVEEGPAEQVVTDRMEAIAAERRATGEWAGARSAARESTRRERGMQAAAAWDLRLLDVLGTHLAVTQELVDDVAERGDTEALRAWADEEGAQLQQWRREIALLRASWYGDPRPPGVTEAPDLDDLGPVTEDLAERVDGDTGDELAATPFDATVSTSRARLGTGPISLAHTADALIPFQRRGAAVARAGTMQASREELRTLALRIQLGEQRSLARLRGLIADE